MPHLLLHKTDPGSHWVNFWHLKHEPKVLCGMGSDMNMPNILQEATKRFLKRFFFPPKPPQLKTKFCSSRVEKSGTRNLEYKITFPFYAVVHTVTAHRFWNYFKHNKYEVVQFYFLNILLMKRWLMLEGTRICNLWSWWGYSHSGAVKDKIQDLPLEHLQKCKEQIKYFRY